MLTGRVTSEREAVVPIEILDAEEHLIRFEATLDTGYDGFLTMPRSLIDELGLAFIGPARAALGDGKEVRMNLFLGAVRWDDGLRDALVLEAEGGILVGMAMLVGCRVSLDVEEDGVVSIESLDQIRPVN